MNITIRQARNEDIPQMCGLLAELFTIESDFTPDAGRQARGLGMLVSDASGRSFTAVAMMGSEVVAMGTVQTFVSTAEGGLAGLVEDVIVRKDLRGKGLGSRILSRITDWSREKGLTRLQLLADRDNRTARDFYVSNTWISTKLICMRKPLEQTLAITTIL
jgi:GNAT superfamily N-acetyltransferase